jgi:hypothetical protein
MKYVIAFLAVLGTFLGSHTYLPFMSHTAFTMLTVQISWLMCACLLVAMLSLGIVSIGRRR